ncbi:unnamed protein product [Calypogeia fissa]
MPPPPMEAVCRPGNHGPISKPLSNSSRNSNAIHDFKGLQNSNNKVIWPIHNGGCHSAAMEEVIQRRVRRLRKLMKVYRSQHLGLVEEMRTKYRRFYLRHGKSGWRDDVEDERDGAVPDGG